MSASPIRIAQLPVAIKRLIPSAVLPDNYRAACQALAACVAIDECKEWADKAAAIATYAKQARDQSLLAMAKRIRLRAYQRIGELLDDDPAPSRLTARARRLAASLGITATKARDAQLIAGMNHGIRESRIESEMPPSVSKLASEARRLSSKDRGLADGTDHSQHWEALVSRAGGLISMANFLTRFSPAASYAKTFSRTEASWLRAEALPSLTEWLDEFEQYLPK